MNTRYVELLNYFPPDLRKILEKTFTAVGDSLYEIRIRCGKPLAIGTSGGVFCVLSDGMPSPAVGGAYIISERDLKLIFQAVCENSVYAFMDEIKQGFITVKGGHRVGFCGRTTTEKGKIENFREISSINIRVAHEVLGAANYIINEIVKPDGIVNTLLVSPPMGGKTTVLRDIARQISDKGTKTALIDERGELGALFRGMPQNDVGLQTDIIENAPKNDAIIMMLKTMSPQLIVADEIASKEDCDAIQQCFGTGVSVIATTHGSAVEDVVQRQNIKPLLGDAGFKQIILLKKEGCGINTKVFGTVAKVGCKC